MNVCHRLHAFISWSHAQQLKRAMINHITTNGLLNGPLLLFLPHVPAQGTP